MSLTFVENGVKVAVVQAIGRHVNGSIHYCYLGLISAADTQNGKHLGVLVEDAISCIVLLKLGCKSGCEINLI